MSSSEQVYRDNTEMLYKIGLEAIDKLNPKASENVLDVGCGDGRLTLQLAKKISGGKLVGVDLSEKMLEMASQVISENNLLNTTVTRCDALEMTYNNEFDAIYSNVVIHFIKNQKECYRRMFDALKPGGRLVVTAFQKMPAGKIMDIDMNVMKQLFQKEKYREYIPRFNSGVDGYAVSEKTRKTLEKGGYIDVVIESRDIIQQFPTLEAYMAFSQFGRMEFQLAAFPKDVKQEFWADEKAILKQDYAKIPVDQKNEALRTIWTTAWISAKKPS